MKNDPLVLSEMVTLRNAAFKILKGFVNEDRDICATILNEAGIDSDALSQEKVDEMLAFIRDEIARVLK